MVGISFFLDDLCPAPPVPEAEEAQTPVKQPFKAVEGAEQEQKE